MTDDMIKLVANGSRIYAENFDDLAIVMGRLRADLSITIEQQSSAIKNLAERTKQLEADLVAQREVQVYGPQLTAEHAAALESRDRALLQLEELTIALNGERQSRRDLDKHRRALAADVRRLEGEKQALISAGEELERELERLKAARRHDAAVKAKRKAKR